MGDQGSEASRGSGENGSSMCTDATLQRSTDGSVKLDGLKGLGSHGFPLKNVHSFVEGTFAKYHAHHLQEKSWWRNSVMKSGDLPGFGWMPTIDPSKVA